MIETEPINLNYIRKDKEKQILSKDRGLIFISCILIAISIIIFTIQIFNPEMLRQIMKCKRIQKNVSKWSKIINEITSVEITKGKQVALQINNSGFDYKCYDYGPYYIPFKLNPLTYLPEAIRRGNGDGWVISKSSDVDLPALQFCKYIILKYPSNTITCGMDMFDKIKYSGYFEVGHWCSTALDKIYQENKF